MDASALNFGQLDPLVNSAGISDQGPLDQLSEEARRRVLAVNLDGIFFTCQAAHRYLVSSSHAAIVNVASGAGVIAAARGRPA